MQNKFEILAQSYRDKVNYLTRDFKREIYPLLWKELKTHNLVLVGLRQVGKTTIAEQLLKEYMESFKSKLQSNPIENTLTSQANNDFYYLNIKAMPNIDSLELTKYITDMKFKAVLIDEVQMIKEWTSFAQATIDLNPNTKFIFTGSNAKALSNETMVNRTKVFFINPISYLEFKHFWPESTMMDYFMFGSYPKFDKYSDVKIQYSEIIDEQIIDKVISLDSDGVINDSKFKSLMKAMGNFVGNELVVSSLENKEITRPTITSYLALMESSRLVKRIWKHEDKSDKMKGKAYFIDKSMLFRFNDYQKLDNGRFGSFIENVVFNYLDSEFGSRLSLQNTIEFFIGENRKEIDFIINDQKILIEVKHVEDINAIEVANALNTTLGNQKHDFKKYVITKNFEQEVNGWKFIKLSSLLERGLKNVL